jgi:malonyl-CoA O-methyltransferase
MLDKKITRQHFERAAKTYDASAVLQREVAIRLAERLAYIKLEPKRAVDIGCGTGYITHDLLKRYPKTEIISLDLSLNMLQQTATVNQQGWKKWFNPQKNKPLAICADAESLPLQNQSVDLIASNLMLQWSNNLSETFAGFHAVLAPNGLLLFTTFGPDTLKEMRESWANVDDQPHTSTFVDMHEVGDALLQAGFINPVTDMEVITMTYSSVRQLMKDIKNIGATNTHSGRSKGLMGKNKLQAFEQAYEQFKTPEGLYPASWEIIYGHAWVGEGFKVEGFDKVIPITVV